MSKSVLALLLGVISIAAAAQTGSAAPDPAAAQTGSAAPDPRPCQKYAREEHRPAIGLALEGGVALGLAHVGVIEWLEQNRIPVDCISGTSMGGLIGGLFAMGYSPITEDPASPDNMFKFLRDTFDNDGWQAVFYDRVDYGDLSITRKQDQRTYPSGLELRLNRGIGLMEGVTPAHRLGLILDHFAAPYYGIKTFNDLPIPFRCAATDIVHHESELFGRDIFREDVGARGVLSEALRATMSTPGYFKPVQIPDNSLLEDERDGNDKLYVDGGVLQNIPITVLREMGADVVIAVHLVTPKIDPSKEVTPLDVLSNTMSVVTAANEDKSLDKLRNSKNCPCEPKDIRIDAHVERFTSTSFDKWREVSWEGYRAAREMSSELMKYQLDEAHWYEYHHERAKNARSLKPGVVAPKYVLISTESAVSSQNAGKHQPNHLLQEEVRRSLGCDKGTVVKDLRQYQCLKYVPQSFRDNDATRLEHKLNSMVGSGRFSRIGYHILPTPTAEPSANAGQSQPGDDPQYLNITAVNRDYTGVLIKPVLQVDGTNYDDPIFALGARFTAFDVVAPGSEWRAEALLGSRYGLSTEYMLPLFNFASHLFISSGGTAESSPFNIYHDRTQLAHYDLRTISGVVDVGYNFGQSAQLRVGYEGGGIKLSHVLGDSIFPFTSSHIGTTHLRFSFDRLSFPTRRMEPPTLPRNGVEFTSSFDWHDAWLGASDHFPSAAGKVQAFKSTSASGTAYIGADGGSTLDYANTGLPIFSMGGTFGRMAAYGTNELLTNRYWHGTTGYIQRLYQFKSFFGGGIYAIASAELAKVYENPAPTSLPRDGTAGIVLDSVVGPLFIGGSVGDHHHGKVFFYLGRLF